MLHIIGIVSHLRIAMPQSGTFVIYLVHSHVSVPEPGMDSCGIDAGDTGGHPLHARQVEAASTHCGGVQRVHTSLPVHSGVCVCVCGCGCVLYTCMSYNSRGNNYSVVYKCVCVCLLLFYCYRCTFSMSCSVHW